MIRDSIRNKENREWKMKDKKEKEMKQQTEKDKQNKNKRCDSRSNYFHFSNIKHRIPM